jgi:hypothetical protein
MGRRLSATISLCSLVGLALSVLAGCLERSAWLGGADHFNIPENQTPHIALAAFRQSHPNGQIHWIEAVFSNGPPEWLIHYQNDEAQGPDAVYRYSDHGNLSGFEMYPDAVRASLKRIYPGVMIDRVEFFDDTANHVSFFRFHFHTATVPAETVCFDANGEVYQSSVPER